MNVLFGLLIRGLALRCNSRRCEDRLNRSISSPQSLSALSGASSLGSFPRALFSCSALLLSLLLASLTPSAFAQTTPTISWLNNPSSVASGQTYSIVALGQDSGGTLTDVTIWRESSVFAQVTSPGSGNYANSAGASATDHYSDIPSHVINYSAEAFNSWGYSSGTITTSVSLYLASMTPPTSTNASMTWGTPWSPSITVPSGNGTGTPMYCVSGQTNWQSASWDAANAKVGTYQLFVGQLVDADHTGNENDPIQGAMEDNLSSYTLTVNPKPVTITISGGPFTYNTSPQSVTINCSDLNALSSATITNQTETAAGTYKASVTATGNYTGSASYTWTIGKADQKTPVISITSPPTCSPPTTVNVGDTVYFSAGGGDGTGPYTWSGAATFTGPSFGITYHAIGSYTYTMHRTGDNNYNDSASTSITITVVNPQYNLTVNSGSGGGAFSAGTSVPISANDESSSGFAFAQWVLQSGSGTFGNTSSANTTFTMGSGDATVVAWYSDVQAPTVPSNVQASSIGYTNATITWNPSTDNAAVDHYAVVCNGQQQNVSGNSASFSGLAPGTAYTASVCAIDTSGNASGWATVSFTTTADTTPPSVPQHLGAGSVSVTNLTLSWDPSSDNIATTKYEVFENGTSIGTTSTNGFVVKGLTQMTRYTFTVRAGDDSGNWSAQSAPYSVSTNAPILIGIHAAGQNVPSGQDFTVTSTEGAQANPMSVTSSGAAWTTVHQYLEVAPGIDNTVFVSGPSYQREVRFEVPTGYTLFLNHQPYTNTATITLGNAGGGTYNSPTETFTLVPNDGTTALRAGYSIDPQISVNDVIWSISLGRTPDGRTLGALTLRKTDVTGTAFTADALELTGPAIAGALEIHPDSDYGGPWGSDRRFIQSVGNAWLWIDDHVSGEPQGYVEIKAYDAGATPQWSSSLGTYEFMESGAEVKPFAHYAISSNDPTNDTITITKNVGLPEQLSWTLQKSVSGSTTTWVLRKANNQTLRTVYTVSGSTTSATITLEDGSSNVAQTYTRSYQMMPWGKNEIMSETDDTLTTTYTYGTTSTEPSYGKLTSVTKPDGTYVAYDYCSDDAAFGNLWHTYTPWLDVSSTAATATSANARTVTLTYKPVHSFLADALDTTTTTVPVSGAAVTVAQTVRNPDFTSTTFAGKAVRKETIQAYSNASSYLTTTRLTYHPDDTSDDSANRLISQTNPDGTKLSAIYYLGTFTDNGDSDTTLFKSASGGTQWGEYEFHGFSTQVSGSQAVTSWDGQSIDTIYMVPNRSTIDLTVVTDGEITNVVHYAFVSASGGVPTFAFIGSDAYTVTTTTDSNGIATTVKTHTSSNGAQTSQTFVDGRLNSETGNDGSVTNYTYDASAMLVTKESTGIAGSGNYAAQGSVYTHYTYDGASRKLTEKVSDSADASVAGPTTTYTYDSAGRLSSQTDPSGLMTSFAYDLGTHTTTTTLPGGATKVVTTYADGTTKSVTGTAVVGSYNDVTVNADGTVTTTAYVLRSSDVSNPTSAPRWSSSTTDWLGRTIRSDAPDPDPNHGTVAKLYSYNAKGELTSVDTVDGSNTATHLLATAYTDYNAYEMPYRTGLDLDSSPDLQPTSATDRITESDTVFSKDAAGAWWLVKTSSVYNQASVGTAVTTATVKTRLNKFTGGVQSESVSLDSYGNQTDTTITVDRTNRLVTQTTILPDSAAHAVSITVNGLLQSSQSSSNLTTTYAYDSLRRLVCTSDPRIDGSTLAQNLPARIGYFDGTAPVGSRYQKAWTKDTAGNQTSYTYSASTGRLASTEAPLLPSQSGKFTYYDYTLRGELYRTWGDTTYPVQYGFDDYGQKTTMTTYRTADSTTWTQATWPASPPTGDTTTWNYDNASGALFSKVDAAGKSVTYTYTKLGAVKTRTWARGISETYTYYGETSGEPMTGELESVDYSDTPSTNPDVSYTYTRTGQADTVTDATGSRSFAYDPNHLVLTSETLDNSFFGGRVLTLKYDSASGTAGRSTGYTLSSGATTEQDIGYGYDSYGRFNSLSTVSPSLSSTSVSFTYTYAPGSDLISAVVDSDSGWTQTRTWNAARNLLDSIGTIVDTTAKAQFAYAYDAWARRTSVVRTGEMYSRYENGGLVTTWGYDDRSEVTSAQSYYSTSITNLNAPVEGRNYAYSFDSIGNRLTSSIDTRTTNYTSNSLNQISSRTTPGSVDVSGFAPSSSTVGVTVQGNAASPTRAGDYFHAVGAVSNSGTSVDASVTVTSTSPNASITRKRFVPMANNSGAPWQYDLDGNLTQDDQWDYTWDAENRLISMETRPDLISPNANVIAAADARRIEFTYDYLGRRVQKLVRSGWNGTSFATVLSTTRFIYNGWNLIAEYTVSSSSTLILDRSFTWGIDLSGSGSGAGGVGGLLLMQDSSGQFEYGYDGNGNVSCVVNRATGATVAEYEYSPFGEPLRATGVYAQLNPFRFSTKYVDDETGLLYYGYRYYDPHNGRFLGRDSKGEDGGLNLYGFCLNNAINAWDMLGHVPQAMGGGVTWNGTPYTYYIDPSTGSASMSIGDPTGMFRGPAINGYNVNPSDWLGTSGGQSSGGWGGTANTANNPASDQINQPTSSKTTSTDSGATPTSPGTGSSAGAAPSSDPNFSFNSKLPDLPSTLTINSSFSPVPATDSNTTLSVGSALPDFNSTISIDSSITVAAGTSITSNSPSPTPSLQGSSPTSTTSAPNSVAIDATAAKASYDMGKTAPAGYSVAQVYTIKNGDGTDAVLFRSNTTGDLILAYRGSQTLSDWETDFYNALGGNSSRYRSAVNIAKDVQLQNPGVSVTLVGHSLGGGEAALAAAATGLNAITFNAAGVNLGNYGYANARTNQITNYSIIGEPLTTFQLLTPVPNALGNQVYLAPHTLPTLGNAFNHGSGSVLSAVGASDPVPVPGG